MKTFRNILATIALAGLLLAILLRFALPARPTFLPVPTALPAPDPATTHLATANKMYYEKLPKADSAARLQRFDSTLATW